MTGPDDGVYEDMRYVEVLSVTRYPFRFVLVDACQTREITENGGTDGHAFHFLRVSNPRKKFKRAPVFFSSCHLPRLIHSRFPFPFFKKPFHYRFFQTVND